MPDDPQLGPAAQQFQWLQRIINGLGPPPPGGEAGIGGPSGGALNPAIAQNLGVAPPGPVAPPTAPTMPALPGLNTGPSSAPGVSSRRNLGPSTIQLPDTPGWKPGDPGILPPTPQMPQMPQIPYPAAPQQIQLPETPQLPAAPKLPSFPAGPDFSQARSWMDKAGPTAPDMGGRSNASTAAILAGLAQGAGGVSATEPGSFAKALAMAGAGGSTARSKGLEEGTAAQERYEREKAQYAAERGGQEAKFAEATSRHGEEAAKYGLSGAEMQQKRDLTQGEMEGKYDLARAQLGIEQAKEQHQYEVAKYNVDFQNAKNVVDTEFKNAQLMYEHGLKEMGLRAPEIKSVSGGMSITQMQPDGSYKTELIDTRPMWEKMDNIMNYYKGTGSEVIGQVHALAQMTMPDGSPIPPPMKTAMLYQLGLKDIIHRGQGGAVFGKEYLDAEKAIDADMKRDPSYVFSQAKEPLKVSAEREQKIAARLFDKFISSGDSSWVAKWNQYSDVGRMWSNGNPMGLQ